MSTHKANLKPKVDKAIMRERRILKMMSDRECHIEPSANSEFVIINIAGFRRVKCELPTIQRWLSGEWVVVSCLKDKSCIQVTDIGKAMLKREEISSHAAPHRALYEDMIQGDDGRQSVVRNANESPLSRLYSHNRTGRGTWLDNGEFSAGERFRADFEYAHLNQRVTASWDPTANLSNAKGGRRPSETLSERAMASRQRLNKAIDAVGPELSGILLDVCCFLKGMEQVEAERRWPGRSAKLILKIALSVLARHYMPAENENRRRRHHWGTADYRPKMQKSGG